MRWSRAKLVHGSSPLRTRSMYGTYSARQASASRSQSPCTPCAAPRRRASSTTPVRQSTVVPKMSNVRARTPACCTGPLIAPEGAVVFREVALDHRKIEARKYGVRGLALEQEVEAPRNQALHVFAFSAAGPTLEIRSADGDRMPRVLACMVNYYFAQPAVALGFGAHLDHRTEATGCERPRALPR